MPTFALYLFKVILCSALLFGYYHLFLRNKVYHVYNRFYLLAAVIISILAPVINFTMLFASGSATAKPIQLLQVVNNGDQYLEEVILYSHRNNISTSQVLLFTYSLISLFFLFGMIKMIVQIVGILKTNTRRYINDVVFVESNAKGTPFSFFKFIFWNSAIDIHSQTGQQIFAHELAHVREKHSADKLFINIVLIFCWINPVFWLIKKELNLIHEFIADKKAVANNDAGALAAMIVTSAYPKHAYLLTNHFFYSPIKRRLQMLSKYNTKKAGYFYRILALPVILFLLAAFTIKTKTGKENILNPANKIIVVIDAGHGGQDAGAMAIDGTREKDLTLDILKKIKVLNTLTNINLIFTREVDVYQSPTEKAAFIKQTSNADLLISLHVSSGPSKVQYTVSGVEVYVSNDENKNSAASKLFASSLISHFAKNYDLYVAPYPKERPASIAILKASGIPSVIIETGFINNPKDLAFLKSDEGKEQIAKNILAAIAQYADNRSTQLQQSTSAIFNSIKDTTPEVKASLGFYKGQKIKVIEVSKDCEIVHLQLDNGNLVSMSMFEAKKQQIKLPTLPLNTTPDFAKELNSGKYNIDASERITITGDKIQKHSKENPRISAEKITISVRGKNDFGLQASIPPLVILDGKEISYADMNNINSNNIESINVLKGEGANALYGAAKSINGVIEVFLKKEKTLSKDKPVEIPNAQPADIVVNGYRSLQGEKVFNKLEEEASFPGGKDAWTAYLRQNLNANMPLDEGWSAGTFQVMIKFIVSKDGSISDVVAENYSGSKTAQMCVDFIKKGPRWIPGKQNNLIVNSYKKQPITFVIQDQ